MTESFIIRELISLIKIVLAGYLIVKLVMYQMTVLEEIRTKNSARIVKAASILIDEKLRKFIDFLLKELEDKKPQE
jgi:hypothetical protein